MSSSCRHTTFYIQNQSSRGCPVLQIVKANHTKKKSYKFNGVVFHTITMVGWDFVNSLTSKSGDKQLHVAF